MTFSEIDINSNRIKDILDLSFQWELENITYGYIHNELEDIEGNRFFVAVDKGDIVAYLFGKMNIAENMSAVIPDGSNIFVIDELYVNSDLRSKGIGKSLFKYAEHTVKSDNVKYITLNTATKNYKSVLHFYIDIMDMNFWSAQLYKKLG